MEKINNQIQELLLAKSQNKSIGERIEYLEDKLNKLALKEQAYLLRTEEELNDVRKLESLGLRSLFNKILGNLEEQLEKEKQEYLLAVIDHNSVKEEIEILKYEKDILQNKYRSHQKLDSELDGLIKKKEFLLKSYDSNFTKTLFQKESELGRYKLLVQKKEQLKSKAEQAKEVLNQILKQLEQVIDWPPSGKGKYASYAKKKYIDVARSKAVQAKVRLDEYIDLSSKLLRTETVNNDISEFENFLDHFYENLITDYVVKSHLEKTMDNIEDSLEDLSRAQQSVDVDLTALKTNISKVNDEMNQYILEYGIKEDE